VLDLEIFCEQVDEGEAGSGVVALDGRGEGVVEDWTEGTQGVKDSVLQEEGRRW